MPTYTPPNNLVNQYNAGQRQADPSKIDENFSYCTDALNTIDTALNTPAAEGTNGIAQIATQAIAQAGTDDSNKFLNSLKGKYLVQSLLNPIGNLGTSYSLTTPVSWNNQITGGSYYVPGNAGNSGGPTTGAYHLVVSRYTDAEVFQVAYPDFAGSAPVWRAKIGGNWGSWAPFVAEISPAGGSVSVTGATTLTTSAFGKLHICADSGADYVVTLPSVASSSGKTIGFAMVSGLTKLVTVKGNGAELIDGSNTRIMWAGESATLYCDGNSWYKIAGKTIPMMATRYLDADKNPGAGVTFLVPCNTTLVAQCPAAMTSGSGVITVLRSGSYYINGSAWGGGWGGTYQMSIWPSKNGTPIYEDADFTSGSYTRTGGEGGGFPAVAGDVLGLYVNSPAAFTVKAGTKTSITVAEIPNW